MTNTTALQYHMTPGGCLQGQIRVPGDKSISHRSIILGSLADGVVEVSGFLNGEDCLATLKAFQAMGVHIEGPTQDGQLVIHGVGIDGLKAPVDSLYLGNSGTSMRLLSGLLAGQSFATVLTGDQSLSGRPMRRVTDPLSTMGADIQATANGTAPLHIQPATDLAGIEYQSPVASAQVKSSLLLAGLYAQGETAVIEPGVSRDHSERMLQSLGYDVTVAGSRVSVQGGGRLSAGVVQVPADLSSAAFFLVGASIIPGSDLILRDVGINPTRTGVLDVLKLMGANINIENQRDFGAEPVADLHVKYAPLTGIDIPPALVPLAIDEFPALFIAAACAKGTTTLTEAEELRVKESDRIQVMADGLQALGIDAQPQPDGIVIVGGQFSGGQVQSHGDHRIAMSFAMAAMLATAKVCIHDCDNVATSFPGFAQLAAQTGMQITEVNV